MAEFCFCFADETSKLKHHESKIIRIGRHRVILKASNMPLPKDSDAQNHRKTDIAAIVFRKNLYIRKKEKQ